MLRYRDRRLPAGDMDLSVADGPAQSGKCRSQQCDPRLKHCARRGNLRRDVSSHRRIDLFKDESRSPFQGVLTCVCGSHSCFGGAAAPGIGVDGAYFPIRLRAIVEMQADIGSFARLGEIYRCIAGAGQVIGDDDRTMDAMGAIDARVHSCEV